MTDDDVNNLCYGRLCFAPWGQVINAQLAQECSDNLKKSTTCASNGYMQGGPVLPSRKVCLDHHYSSCKQIYSVGAFLHNALQS